MNTNQMRKFPREYCAKYPSIAKVYEAVAGARRRGSEISVSNYVNAVAKFVKYLGFSDPETALKAMLNGEVNAGEKVDSFIDYALKELGNSHATTRNSVFGIKKWMDLNGLKIEWAKIELPTSAETTENDRAPTKDELKMLLNHASSARDRFFIFAATSSGLRVGTILSLKIGDVDLSYLDVARITVERKRGRKFSIRGGANSRFFVTWLTPEAKNSLTQYLTERKQAGEELTPESPLIGDYLHKGTFIAIEAIQRNWVRLLKRAGLAKKSTNWYELHIHTLRKYFRSNCIGVDVSFREKWMGHRGQYLDMSYFKAEENLNLAEYRKTISHLTIYSLPTEEKKLRSQMLMDFAKLQGYEPEQLKKLEEVLARSKDLDEGISEFRKLKEGKQAQPFENTDRQPKNIIVKGDTELLKKLEDGYSLVQPLDDEKFLMKL